MRKTLIGMTDVLPYKKYCATFPKVFEYFAESSAVLSAKYDNYLI